VGRKVGVSGEEDESEVGDDGERGGISSSAESGGVGVRGRGANKLRSGYKCRDFNNEFSDLKNRMADRRLSTLSHQPPVHVACEGNDVPDQKAENSPVQQVKQLPQQPHSLSHPHPVLSSISHSLPPMHPALLATAQ
jgi:hypothetical protein